MLTRGRGIQAYFIAMSGLHRHEISELLGGLKKQVKKATEDELEASQFCSLSVSFPLMLD